MARAASFFNLTLLATVGILLSSSIVPSTACFTTETIDKDRQWACWNFNRGGGYTSKDMCCSGTVCECDESGSFATNARFGRDCKCATTAAFVEEYYTRIMAEQQQRINVMQQERLRQSAVDDVQVQRQERNNSTKL